VKQLQVNLVISNEGVRVVQRDWRNALCAPW